MLTPKQAALERARGQSIRNILMDAIAAHTQIEDVALELGISRPTLNAWLAQLGVSYSRPLVPALGEAGRGQEDA